VWKFSFSAIQILREIIFWNFRSLKIAISTVFEVLKFDFEYILYFFEAEICQKQNSDLLKM